mgnify:FL=1
MERLIFDTHSHYTDAAFDEDRDAVLQALPAGGVAQVMLASVDAADTEKNLALTERYDYMLAAAGTHPENLPKHPVQELERIAALAMHPNCYAIGEIGLDYHYEGYDKAAQIALFQEQLTLAKERDLPVIVHIRDATADALQILKDRKPKGVVHCFSGSAETAEAVLKLGMYIGFTGILTFKNAKKALRALAVIPNDRFVLETDCPYMAPVPYRGKRCDSRMIIETAKAAAAVKNLTVEQVLRQTLENGRRLYACSGYKTADMEK